jgi:hypothetical protein
MPPRASEPASASHTNMIGDTTNVIGMSSLVGILAAPTLEALAVFAREPAAHPLGQIMQGSGPVVVQYVP